MTAVEYGPARYRIVARWTEDGCITRGASYAWGPALLDAVRCLVELRGNPLTPLRVEPVPGTQYRITYSGAHGFWWAYDANELTQHIADHTHSSARRIRGLVLRSPVQS